MNHILRATAVFSLLVSANSALAAGPDGVWTWTTLTNGEVHTSTLRLKFNSESKALSGYYSASESDPQIPLAKATYHDGDITATVLLDHLGKTYDLTFAGSRIGDSLIGTLTITHDGQTHTTDWTAARSR
jgi:hypothetical protein